MKSKRFVTIFGLCALGLLFSPSGNAWANADLPDVIPPLCLGLTNVEVGNPSGTTVKGMVSFVTADLNNRSDIDVTLSLSLKKQGSKKDLTETVLRAHMVQVDLDTKLVIACQVANHFDDEILALIKGKTKIILTDESITSEGNAIQLIPGSNPPRRSAITEVRLYLD